MARISPFSPVTISYAVCRLRRKPSTPGIEGSRKIASSSRSVSTTSICNPDKSLKERAASFTLSITPTQGNPIVGRMFIFAQPPFWLISSRLITAVVSPTKGCVLFICRFVPSDVEPMNARNCTNARTGGGSVSMSLKNRSASTIALCPFAGVELCADFPMKLINDS